jgi:hypothetical protein
MGNSTCYSIGGLKEPSSKKVGRSSRLFVFSAGGVLLITGLAKVLSALGRAQVLEQDDPIFGISFRYLMFSVGVIELFISAICILTTKQNLSLGLVALLSTNFLGYRMGLLWIGYHGPCSCLGNLTDAIHLPPKMADSIMKLILAYLLVGSYAMLFCLWKQNLLLNHRDHWIPS